MRVLLDSSVLVRLANPTDWQHPLAVRAVDVLRQAGNDLCITPQVMIEFRAVATRPVANNGLGYSAQEAESLATGFETAFLILLDTPTVYGNWKSIVNTLAVIGKTVHDARLVAVCHVYSVSHLMTFNLSHYQTLSQAPPGLVVLDPVAV